jgi:hypothetical protein
MIFTGEASWRWRMLRPAADRAYERFWQQTARWLSSTAPDPVTVIVPERAEAGDALDIVADVRDAGFAPAADATVSATVTWPDGTTHPLTMRHESGGGRFTAAFNAMHDGLHRVRVEAHRGAAALGAADRWFLVGAAQREFADPRLNEGLLQRLAAESGGRYARVADTRLAAAWLHDAAPRMPAPERRELWHEPWAFLLVIALLTTEWVLRRRWELR